MRFIDTKSFLAVTQTCRQYRELQTVEWGINAKLSLFLEDPQDFRSQLGRCKALISGSFALQFFERILWPEADLEIMIEQGTDVVMMDQHLIAKECYSLTSTQDVGRYRFADLIEVRKSLEKLYR